MLNSPARTRSWWGVFVSLFASIALAIAMVAVPAPKAEAQSSVTQPVDGVARGNNGPTGYPLIQVGDPNSFTSAVIWINIGGKEYAAYCIEGKLGLRPEGGETGQVVPWSSYRSAGGNKGNLLSGNDYSEQRQEKLSWIAYNSYPYKSVEEMSELLGIPKLNMPDVVAATQAAVSHYSDGFEFEFKSKRRNSQRVYDYLTGPANIGIKAGDLKGLGGTLLLTRLRMSSFSRPRARRTPRRRRTRFRRRSRLLRLPRLGLLVAPRRPRRRPPRRRRLPRRSSRTTR